MNLPEIPEHLPFLERLCWQRADIHHLAPFEMLQQYERGWHYHSLWGTVSAQEAAFIQHLAACYGSWLGTQMFNQPLHQKILKVLHQLNAEVLRDAQTYFGGGTFISLSHAEYRLSKDIDFICSSRSGYRQLRNAVGQQGYEALFHTSQALQFPRDIQANQYGIRFPVRVEGIFIKFEIICEGRIDLGLPDTPPWCPVACLNPTDIVAEKLLANADRWIDASTESRDLIDLAVLRMNAPFSGDAIDKAQGAYEVLQPLQKALLRFQQQPQYRTQCFESLQIAHPAWIIDGIDLLAADFGFELTERTFDESRAPWESLDF